MGHVPVQACSTLVMTHGNACNIIIIFGKLRETVPCAYLFCLDISIVQAIIKTVVKQF